jgi:hypothetical protein
MGMTNEVNTRDCKHGHLARSCPACESEQAVQELRAEIERLTTQRDNYRNAVNSKQAKIDALMLEFCPGEMSPAQRLKP